MTPLRNAYILKIHLSIFKSRYNFYSLVKINAPLRCVKTIDFDTFKMILLALLADIDIIKVHIKFGCESYNI